MLFIGLQQHGGMLGVILVRKLIEKFRNLCEILLLPAGIELKYRYPNFHWRDYRMCLRLRAAGVDPASVIDVGANEGQFAIGARRAFRSASIYSFEPGKEAFARLEKNMARMSRVHCFRMALGEQAQTCVLNVANFDQSSSLLPLHRHHIEAYPDVRIAGSEEVKVNTLTSMVDNMELKQPVLLKIDTQGCEMSVLLGAQPILHQFQWIVLETSTRPMYEGEVVFEKIVEWLNGRGFKFVAPVEIHLSRGGVPSQFDALFKRDS